MSCDFVWKENVCWFKKQFRTIVCKMNALIKGEIRLKPEIIFVLCGARFSWGFCWYFQLLLFIIPCPFSFPDLQPYSGFRVTLTLSTAINYDFANCSVRPGVNWWPPLPAVQSLWSLFTFWFRVLVLVEIFWTTLVKWI